MRKKPYLFTVLQRQYLFMLIALSLILGFMAVLLFAEPEPAVLIVCLAAGTLSAVFSLALYFLRIRPEYNRYRSLTRRFRDGEIYQDYVRGIDGLFPDLAEDVRRIRAVAVK